MTRQINGRPYWVGADAKYAMWHDGHNGTDADWWFGPSQNVGNRSTAYALMASDEEAECPYNVTDWTRVVKIFKTKFYDYDFWLL